MHTPFAPAIARTQRRERRRQIDVPRDRTVPALHDLVQVDAVVKCRERFLGVEVDSGHAQRRTELELGNANACRRQPRESVGGILELHSAVTDVVAEAEVTPQRFACLLAREAGRLGDNCGARVGVHMILKERERLLDRLKEAAGFGLKREDDFSAAALLQPDQCPGMPCHHVGHGARRVRAACRDGLECSRHCRHRAWQSFGKQLAENLGGLVGVAQPLGREPVGLVDIFLHARSMKRAVRKRIDREDVEIVPRQKRAQLVERRWLAQRLRRDSGEPQTESERCAGRNRSLDPRQMRLEAVAHLRPALAGMDVGAIGEMHITGKIAEPHDRLLKAVSIAP